MARFGLILPHVLLALLITKTMSVRADDSEPSQALNRLFDAEWEWTLEEHPTFASSLGDKRGDDRWPDVSLDAFERRHAHRLAVLEQLRAIDVDSLSPADKLNDTLFRKQYETDVAGHRFRRFLVPLSHREGIQDANSLADDLSFDTVEDYENWIVRLRSLPTYIEQTMALMREGLKTRRVQPKVVMARVPRQLRRQVVDDPAQSLFFKPFRDFNADISEADQRRLVREATEAIAKQVVPAYATFLEFFEQEYLPGCFEQVGVWQAPDGRELYEYLAHDFTTTDLTPKEIHEIGLSEVQRIRGEMQAIIKDIGFEGSFEEFLEHLRTDPKFYFQDPDELLEAYRAVCKQVDPNLVKLFRKLPRIPYGVEPIPLHLAPDTTTAYYRPPSADGSRAGTYFVNLYKPDARPKYEIEVLSLHESVPGHHLQIALAQEMEQVPAFRRFAGYTAFVEGWGLYSEGLGEDLGLYRDPYAKFGRLTYDMWRAVRLVVDTGMHSFEWTREDAIDFFKKNAAKTEHDIVIEIDRYIAWPGQALAYKIGEMKIRELRDRAKQELGEEFDIRDFHNAVLEGGAVPLDVLEANVNQWIQRESGRGD